MPCSPGCSGHPQQQGGGHQQSPIAATFILQPHSISPKHGVGEDPNAPIPACTRLVVKQEQKLNPAP